MFSGQPRVEKVHSAEENRIENVFILTQGNVGAQVVFLTHFVFATAYVDVAVVVIPCRDAVTPPQLTGDTPVLNIAHPEKYIFSYCFGTN